MMIFCSAPWHTWDSPARKFVFQSCFSWRERMRGSSLEEAKAQGQENPVLIGNFVSESVCELVHGHHFYSGFRTWSSSSTSVGPRPRNFHISCLHMSITCIFEEVTFTLWWHKRFSTQLKIKVCRWEIGDETPGPLLGKEIAKKKKIFLVVSLAQYYMYSRRVWGVPVGIERDEKSLLICKSFWSVWGEGKKLAAKCKALFFSSSTFLKEILKNPPQSLKISSCSNEFV